MANVNGIGSTTNATTAATGPPSNATSIGVPSLFQGFQSSLDYNHPCTC